MTKCPCIGCYLEHADKNNETCSNCRRRIAYVNSIGPAGISSADERLDVAPITKEEPVETKKTALKKKPGRPPKKAPLITLTCPACEKTRDYPKEIQNNGICIFCQAKADNKKNKPIPEPQVNTGKPKPAPIRIDLSTFKKIKLDRHIDARPLLKVKDSSFFFNRAAVREFNLAKVPGVDVFMSKNGKNQIVFCPGTENPTFPIHNYKKSTFTFSSKKLIQQTGLTPGKYPIQNVDGMLLVELGK